MLKVIAVGDPHFRTDNIPEVEMFIEKMVELVNAESPDLVVILGDILHTHERLHTTPLNKAVEFIKKMADITETIVLVGNHDSENNQIFLTENHWMNSIKFIPNITVVDTVIYREIKGVKLLFCPYVPPGRFEEALKTLAVSSNTTDVNFTTVNCIFAHQEFYGCKMGAIASVEGDRWPLEYPHVVSGHIHSRQIPQENIYYCGASMQHAFGESEKNIIPILTWDVGSHASSHVGSGSRKSRKRDKLVYQLREVDLELPRKRIVYTDIDKIEDYKLPETEDKIKITVSGVYDEFKAFKRTKKYKDLIKSGTKVVFKPKKSKEEKSLTTKLAEENEEHAAAIEEGDFHTILNLLVNKERNNFLCQAFEMVVNGKDISEEDILFL